MPDRTPYRSVPSEVVRRFRRRLRLVAAASILGWTVVVAVIAGVSSGYWGDLGLPTDDEGQPRGLLVIGTATLVAGLATSAAYRRVSAPVTDLLRAAAQVGAGEYGDVDVEARGPRELRLLVGTFNEMAARLAADEEQRRRFLADVTHELRNPLAVLQSEIEAQLDGVHPRDDHHLSSLLDETERIAHLLNDLHTLALAEAGRLVLRWETATFDVLVEHTVERHAARATQRGVTLRTSLAPGAYEMSLDPARVRQIIDNLVSNAIRHTPPNGDVLIEVTYAPPSAPGSGAVVECRITDAGPGFPADAVNEVFDRYKRAGDSSGSGLGLSIARDLVVAHGGSITATNVAASGGACVHFELPTDLRPTVSSADHAEHLAPIEIGLGTNLIGTDDLVRERLRLDRDAGVKTLRVGLQADLQKNIDAALSDLARLLELVADINR